MMLSRGVLTLGIALLVALGPRAAAAKHKGSSRQPASTRTTKRVAPGATTAPARPRVAPPTTRDDGGASTAGAGARSRGDSDRQVEGAVPAGDGQGSGNPAANSTTGTTRPAKTKVYTFGAMDVEGKLKTPQLLYFLNRIKLELEMSAPDHRSFMKELEKTAEDPNL